MNINLDPDLFHFLTHAPKEFKDGEKIKKFQLKNGDYVHCVLWNMHFYITGTDIVKILVWRFQNAGRQLVSLKKFEEGVFSDLRNLKPGVDSTLEGPRSEFLEFLYKNGCIRTQKKQKVFFWFSVPHDALFCDALERDLRRETNLLTYSKYLNNFKQPMREMRLSRQQGQVPIYASSMDPATNNYNAAVGEMMKKNNERLQHEFGYIQREDNAYASIIGNPGVTYNSSVEQLRKMDTANIGRNRVADKKMMEKMRNIGEVLRASKKRELGDAESDSEQIMSNEMNQSVRTTRDSPKRNPMLNNGAYLRNLNNSSLFVNPDSEAEMLRVQKRNDGNLAYDPYRPISPPDSFKTRGFTTQYAMQHNSISPNSYKLPINPSISGNLSMSGNMSMSGNLSIAENPSIPGNPAQESYHPSHFNSRFNAPPDQFMSGLNKRMTNFATTAKLAPNPQKPDNELYKPEGENGYFQDQELFRNAHYQNEIDSISGSGACQQKIGGYPHINDNFQSPTSSKSPQSPSKRAQNNMTEDYQNNMTEDYQNNMTKDYHNNYMYPPNESYRQNNDIYSQGSDGYRHNNDYRADSIYSNAQSHSGDMISNSNAEPSNNYPVAPQNLKKTAKIYKKTVGAQFNGGFASSYKMQHDGPYSLTNPSYLENVKMTAEMDKNQGMGGNSYEYSAMEEGGMIYTRSTNMNYNDDQMLFPMSDGEIHNGYMDDNIFGNNGDMLQIGEIKEEDRNDEKNEDERKINGVEETGDNASVKMSEQVIREDKSGNKNVENEGRKNEKGNYVSPDMTIPNTRDNSPQK